MTISKKDRNFLLLIFSLHLSFFLWQLFHGNYFLKDSYEYLQAAANLKSDLLLYCGDLTKPMNLELFTRRTPVYPVFLAACQMVSSRMIFILIIQNLLSVISIYLIRRLILNLGYSARYDFLLIILLLFTPSQFIYANMIMSETLLQFFLILMIWFFVKYWQKGSGYDGILYSLILTLCVMTKPVFAWFLYLNFVFFAWWSFRRKSIRLMIYAVIPIIFLFAWQIRNYSKTEVFETSSIETRALMDYDVNLFLIKTEGSRAANKTITLIDSITALKGTYKEKTTFRKQQAIDIIMKNPLRYTIFHVRGIAGFFLDPGRFDLVNFFNLGDRKSDGLLFKINETGIKGALDFMFKHTFVLLLFLSIIGLFNIFKLVCFVLFIFKVHEDKVIPGFIILLILYVAILTGPLGASRFMMPLVPLYAGCCLLFLSQRKDLQLKTRDKQQSDCL